MQTRKFDELISYFNRKVADMDIDINYKMELLGMVTALGCAHEKELHNPTIEAQPERTEIIRCKDCNKASKCYGDVIMRLRGGGNIYCPLEFCSEAERRTDG